VARKAHAAVEWCKTASRSGARWQYFFVPQSIMEGLTGNHFADLVRACTPALQNLLSETTGAPELPLFGERAAERAEAFFSASTLEKLNPRERKAAAEAAELFRFFEKKSGAPSFAPNEPLVWTEQRCTWGISRSTS
jgi:type III restriction enzyme